MIAIARDTTSAGGSMSSSYPRRASSAISAASGVARSGVGGAALAAMPWSICCSLAVVARAESGAAGGVCEEYGDASALSLLP